MWRWLRKRSGREPADKESVDAAAEEEKEFFDAWDEQGWPDYDAEGNPIHPTWDETAGKWVYPHRETDSPREID